MCCEGNTNGVRNSIATAAQERLSDLSCAAAIAQFCTWCERRRIVYSDTGVPISQVHAH